MFISRSLAVLALVTGFSIVSGNVIAPLSSNVEIRNAPGTTSAETMELLRRALTDVALTKRKDDVYNITIPLSGSWEDKHLFQRGKHFKIQDGVKTVNAGVNVTCRYCYSKGIASAELVIRDGFSISQAWNNFTSDIGDALDNITDAAVDFGKAYAIHAGSTIANIADDDVSAGDLLNFPPFEVDLDVDIPTIPECELKFQFDGLELYMELDTVLSLGATYTINVLTVSSPVGFAVGNDIHVGVTFTLDLIFDVQAQIDVRSGFHIKLDDGIAFSLPMFSKNVTSAKFNGGQFEFLPVSILSGGVVFQAILRVGMRAGFKLSTEVKGVSLLKAADATAEIVAQLWVDVAQLKTTISAASSLSGKACELHVSEEYVLGVGASAGYLLQYKNHTWGPLLATEIPIYSTLLAQACIKSRTSTAVTSSATVKARQQALSLTESTSTTTFMAVECQSVGMINCPASLQSVIKSESEVVYTATLASKGATPVYPTQKSGPLSTVAFGPAALTMGGPSSGAPVAYTSTPGADIKNDINNILNGGINNKIILGVSIGVGLPVLIGLIAGFFCLIRRKRRSARNAESAGQFEQAAQVSQPYDNKKGPGVSVVEYRG